MSILGIVPARGGSKGVKDKNIIDIGEKPLISYTLETALKAKSLDKVVVSTDSDKIASVVRRSRDVQIIKRPAEFARDDSPIEESFFHAIEYLRQKENFNTEILVWMQPNVPIRKNGIIDEVVSFLVNSDADSCVTCYETDQVPEVMKFINDRGRLEPLYDDVCAIRRQEFSKRYLLDGSVVALRVKNLYETRGIRKAHIYLGKEVIPVIQEKKMYSIEIDVPEDIPLVKYYMEQMSTKKKT